MSRPLTQDAAAMYLLAAAVALDTCPTELRASAVADHASEMILPALHRPRALDAIARPDSPVADAGVRRRESARALAAAIRVLLTAAGLEAEDDDYRLTEPVRAVSADTVDRAAHIAQERAGWSESVTGDYLRELAMWTGTRSVEMLHYSLLMDL